MRFVNYLCAHLLCQNLEQEAVRWLQTYQDQYDNDARTTEKKTFCYLIQSVICCNRHSAGVQHQPLTQKSKKAVCVHYLHLPSVDTQTHRHNGTVVCLELPKPQKSESTISLHPFCNPQGARLRRQVSGSACWHKLGKFCRRCVDKEVSLSAGEAPKYRGITPVNTFNCNKLHLRNAVTLFTQSFFILLCCHGFKKSSHS